MTTPNPHGPLVVWVCRACLDSSATYEGRVPKGWRVVDGVAWCRRCRRLRRLRLAGLALEADGAGQFGGGRVGTG
jgi:hypothetical protein